MKNIDKNKKGILLINLGSPSRLDIKAIRQYLREFLSDYRIMDLPPFKRWLILNLFILPFRPGKIISKYEKIWFEGESPLISHSKNLCRKLSQKMGSEYLIDYAMRYGNPSIKSSLENFKAKRVNQILVIPLFPQYSSATTGSILEEVFRIIAKWWIIPKITVIRDFYNSQPFIKAFATKASAFDLQKIDHVLFSFHGLPENHLKKDKNLAEICQFNEQCCQDGTSDCYRAQCYETAREIAAQLNIKSENFSVAFQSRFGRAKWIEPYTDQVIAELAKNNCKNLLVFCPSFVADCLETIEEIGIEANKTFQNQGGEKLTLVPSLNSEDYWVEALQKMIEERNY